MREGNSSIAYLTIKISPEGVSEVHNGRVAVFLRKSEIEGMILTSGSGAENPIPQLVLSAVLLVIGAFGIIPLMAGNFTMLRFKFGFGIFGLIGALLIWEVLRRQTYLLIQTASSKRKLFFKGSIEPEAMAKFLQSAKTDFGYTVDAHHPLPPAT